MKITKILFSILLCACAYAASAQNDIQIERITAINLGDGRLLFRQSESEAPLSGRYRLIDGYRSEYILADFTDGLYDGNYEHFKNNALTESGSYRQGLKHGTFLQYYSDGKTIRSETPLTEGKVDGVVKSYYTDGSLERKKGYKAGVEHGVERYFEHGATEPKVDNNYFEGAMDGRQATFFTSNAGDYFEEKFFDKGKPTGTFRQTWADGVVRVSGQYKDGLKEGVWVENRRNGVPESLITYRAGKRNGESKTFFTDGSVEKITRYVDDRREGVEKTFRYGGQLASEFTWENDRQQGPYKRYYQDGTLREEGRMNRGNEVYRREYGVNGSLERVQERPTGSGTWKTLESYDSDGNQLS